MARPIINLGNTNITDKTRRRLQAHVGGVIDMDFTARLGEMQVPTLLAAAEKDRGGGPPDDMQAKAAAIPGARFDLVKDAGHIVNYEAPDVLAACAADFLGG
jgi:3-oxoadipate enol-lactonase